MVAGNFGARGSWWPSTLKEHLSGLEDLLTLNEWPTTNLPKEIGKSFALDVAETPENYVVTANMPGISRDKINISLEENLLSISVEDEGQKEHKDNQFLHRERWFGTATRSIRLPLASDSDAVSAKLENGVLSIQVAKRPEKKTKTINIS